MHRGRDVLAVLAQYERTVKPAFEEWILPTRKFADIIVRRPRPPEAPWLTRHTEQSSAGTSVGLPLGLWYQHVQFGGLLCLEIRCRADVALLDVSSGFPPLKWGIAMVWCAPRLSQARGAGAARRGEHGRDRHPVPAHPLPAGRARAVVLSRGWRQLRLHGLSTEAAHSVRFSRWHAALPGFGSS